MFQCLYSVYITYNCKICNSVKGRARVAREAQRRAPGGRVLQPLPANVPASSSSAAVCARSARRHPGAGGPEHHTHGPRRTRRLRLRLCFLCTAASRLRLVLLIFGLVCGDGGGDGADWWWSCGQ